VSGAPGEAPGAFVSSLDGSAATSVGEAGAAALRPVTSADGGVVAYTEVTGTTPHNYLVQLRIGHAKRAIRTTSDNITEIAFASGFHDSNYFSSCFSKMTGLSPSEYRRQVQDEKDDQRRKPS